MFKRAKVVMLPTNEKAQLVLGQQLANVGETDIPNDKDITKQHLYITSDDEIKEGDWFIDDTSTIRKSITSDKDYWSVRTDYKKIIATTNTSLIIESNMNIHSISTQYIEKEKSLPQPSKAFVEKYIEEYNKGNIITDVLVEYDEVLGKYSKDIHDTYFVPKVNSKDNTIIIKKVKESWNKEEVKKLLQLGMNKAKSSFNSGEISKWIKENL